MPGDTAHTTKTAMDAVHAKKKTKQSAWKNKRQPTKQCKDKHETQASAEHTSCPKCGKTPLHAKFQCTEKNADCHNCGKRGHYGKVYKYTKSVSVVTEDDDIFLSTVDAGERAWTVDLKVRHTKVTFKIDTGANVTVISEHVYRPICRHRKQPHPW